VKTRIFIASISLMTVSVALIVYFAGCSSQESQSTRAQQMPATPASLPRSDTSQPGGAPLGSAEPREPANQSVIVSEAIPDNGSLSQAQASSTTPPPVSQHQVVQAGVPYADKITYPKDWKAGRELASAPATSTTGSDRAGGTGIYGPPRPREYTPQDVVTIPPTPQAPRTATPQSQERLGWGGAAGMGGPSYGTDSEYSMGGGMMGGMGGMGGGMTGGMGGSPRAPVLRDKPLLGRESSQGGGNESSYGFSRTVRSRSLTEDVIRRQ
jgi:hypothetical protein